jgi:membrane protein
VKRYFDLLKQAFTQFRQDKAQRLGAALAYYTIFSIAPLLLIAIAIAGMVFGKSQAQAQIVEQLQRLIGDAGAKAITAMLRSAGKPKSGTLAVIIGVVTLLVGAASVFGNLKDALDTIWNVEEKPSGGIMAMINQRFLSFAMVLGVGFLLLVTLIFDAAIAALGKYAGNRLPGGEALWQSLQLVVSFGVVTVLFAMIFRYLPDAHVEWHDVWAGAFFTAFLFVIGKFALGLYIGKGAVGSSFGAAASLVVLLVWIYWSTNILFFGAEFTQVYARTRGSMRTSEPRAASGERDSQRAVAVPLAARRTPLAGGGAVKLALGGCIGLFLGALIGLVSGVLLMFKSFKKFFT